MLECSGVSLEYSVSIESPVTSSAAGYFSTRFSAQGETASQWVDIEIEANKVRQGGVRHISKEVILIECRSVWR